MQAIVTSGLLLIPFFVHAEEVSSDKFVRFDGATTSNELGSDVAMIGDVNADGFPDMLIGDYYDTAAGTESGAAYLVYGTAERFTSATADLSSAVRFQAAAEGDKFGFSVAGAGDLNNDGFDDFLIGAPGVSVSRGSVYLFYGKEAAFTGELSEGVELYNGDAGDEFGYSMAGLGDVNGDGFDDMAVGAPFKTNTIESTEYEWAGSVSIVYGQSDPLSTTDVGLGDTIIGDQIVGYFGRSISATGDMDGDGRADLIVGGDGYIEFGRAYLIYGGHENDYSETITENVTNGNAIQFDGVSEDLLTGRAVAGNGDFDGDGNMDLAITSTQSSGPVNEDVGAVYIVYGGIIFDPAVDLSVEGVKFIGAGEDDHLGKDVQFADMDGDGIDDLLVSTPDHNVTPNDEFTGDEGVAYIVYGKADRDFNGNAITDVGQEIEISSIASELYTGEDAGQRFGNAIDAADIDGDGKAELLASASGYNAVGAVYLGYFYEETGEEVENGGGESAVVSGAEGNKNGKITVTYADDSTEQFTVFNISTDKKTIAQQFKDTKWIVVLHPYGKKLALVNGLNGTVKSVLTFSSSEMKYKKNWMKQFNLREDQDKKKEVIVASKKEENVRLSVVRVNTDDKKLHLLDSETLKNSNIVPKKTKPKSKKIMLRNSEEKVLATYSVSKKYALHSQE